jgi:hypothetical protein
LITEQTILRSVGIRYVQKVPETVNTPQLIQHHVLRFFKHAGSDLLAIFVVGMHIVFEWVFPGFATMKGNEEHNHSCRQKFTTKDSGAVPAIAPNCTCQRPELHVDLFAGSVYSVTQA